MSYQVMARKYRPQSFDQMIGQSHITQTILNALKNNRLPHALLFTGLRGTGKTSSARILAKTLRCENPTNFSPCNQCQSCTEISSGRSIDVIEIDGASNNGVDAIRDLRDNVMFAPSSGKYKIFIIDEVHMLSTSAFNALLKTLEEPPAHVVFMLATTEVHKIPQTILSRCQRFDFRRISLKQIADYLKKLCDLENIKADGGALWLIAKQGDGSMRDSLSLLDQVVSFTNADLSEAQVSQVLGLTERTLVYEIFEALIIRDSTAIVNGLQKLAVSGQNPDLFLEDIAKLLRHALLLKTNSKATDFIDLPEDEIQILIQKTHNVSDEDLHLLFDMTIKSAQDLGKASDAQVVFEVALLRMSQAPKVADIKTLLGQPVAVAKNPKLNEAAKPLLSPIMSVAAPEIESKPAAQLKTEPLKQLDSENWMQFVHRVKAKDAFFASKIDSLLFVGCENLKIRLQPPQNLAFLEAQMQNAEMREKLQGFIDSELAQGYTFEVLKSSKSAVGDSAQSLAVKQKIQAEEQRLQHWQTDPRVKKAQEIFNADVRLIKKESP